MTFQIFLRHNKTHTMIVTDETTIEDVHKYILDKLGIPKEHYYLCCGNKVLDVKNTLQDYSINSEKTIHIVIRSIANPVKIKY